MDLTKLSKQTDRLTFDVTVGDYTETTWVDIRPAVLTPDLVRRMTGLQERAEQAEAGSDDDDALAAEMWDGSLGELIAGWDLTRNDEPLPITLDSWMGLPIVWQRAFSAALQERGRVDPQKQGPSDDG